MVGDALKTLLKREIPQYSRGGMYSQAVFVAACGASWLLWPTITGRPVETGVAISALGFAAVIMTVRAEHLTKTEKIVWVVIGFTLFVVEIHVIDQDRMEQEEQHRAEMSRQERQFETTMVEFSKANRGENDHFGRLLEKEDGIFKGMQQDTRTTVDALTGGDSYATVAPIWTSNSRDDEFPLMVHVEGKNTMYDVNIEMQEGPIDPQYMASHIKEYLEGKIRTTYHFPSLSTTYSPPLGKEIRPDPNKINEYYFWSFSRTKVTYEVLQVRFDQDGKRWVNALKVLRGERPTKPILATDFDGKITRRYPK